MNYLQLTGISIREGFEKFNAENPHIYKEFEEQVLKSIEHGRKKISAKLIINWIRWNSFLNTGESPKINDAYQSYYPREFLRLHPEHNGVFEMRKQRNEESGPYMTVEEDGQLSFL